MNAGTDVGPPSVSRAERAWRSAASFVLNFAILFVMVNVVVGFGFTWYDKHRDRTPQRSLALQLLNVPADAKVGVALRSYDGYYTRAEAEEVLDDFLYLSQKGFPYAAWVGYEVPVFHSRMVNVDNGPGSLPLRRSLESASPIAPGKRIINVWCFGGSTTYSVDVADTDTLPSALERVLNQRLADRNVQVRVTNWGRPGYYTSQEVALLQAVLRQSATAPAAVIFLDGVNDTTHLMQTDDRPSHTDDIISAVQQAQFDDNGLRHFTWIPLVRLAFEMRARLHPAGPDLGPPPPAPPDRLVKVYHDNIRMVQGMGDRLGFRSYFFWQPVSFYRYDLSRVDAIPYPLYKYQKAFAAGYAAVEQQEHDAIPLSNLVQTYGHGHVFLDFCHYTPRFIQYMAARMADHIDLEALARPTP